MLTVIIPTLWKIDRLTETLKELENCEHVNQIILIDNTGIERDIQNRKLTYILEKENTYVNPAWNKGVSLSHNDKICILNDDIWFDWDSLKEIDEFISKDIGLLGMSPNNYNISESGKIKFVGIDSDWKTNKGFRPPGYGCCLFIHKENWIPIPEEMKIWAGDDFIFYYQNSRKNYIIEGLRCQGHISFTCNSIENFDQIKINDMYIMKDIIKSGLVENYLIGTIWQ